MVSALSLRKSAEDLDQVHKARLNGSGPASFLILMSGRYGRMLLKALPLQMVKGVAWANRPLLATGSQH